LCASVGNKRGFTEIYVKFKTGKHLPYFPAHKTHRDFFVKNFRKNNDKCILI